MNIQHQLKQGEEEEVAEVEEEVEGVGLDIVAMEAGEEVAQDLIQDLTVAHCIVEVMGVSQEEEHPAIMALALVLKSAYVYCLCIFCGM